MSIFDTTLHIVTTPEAYVGAGVAVASRQIYKAVTFAGALVSIGALIMGAFKKAPKSMFLALTMIVLTITLAGCASGPSLPEEGSKTVYKQKFTPMGPSFCEARRDKLRSSLVEMKKCSENGDLTQECLATFEELPQLKLDYKNCVNHHADTNVVFNPFNIYRN